MNRLEFPLKVRKAAYERANGICECGCGQPFGKERVDYDHIIPAYLGGTNDLKNCQAIRHSCHKSKTRKDMQPIKKVRREHKRRAGLERTKRKISYRRFDGTPVFKN